MLDILWVVVLSLVSLGVLFLLCKLIGKQQIAQMSAFDYVNSITIGSIAAELATNLEEWQKPLTALLVYGTATAAVSILCCRSMKVRHFVNGTPMILYRSGILYRKNLAKAKLDLNSFLEQCRMAGYFDLSQLEAVILEPSGQLSLLPKAAQRPLTPEDMKLTVTQESIWSSLILDGKLLEENLKASGFGKDWLDKQLHARDLGPVSQIAYAACDRQGRFFACRLENTSGLKDFF